MPPISTRSLTWLHLSDLHWKESEAYDQNVVLTKLLEDLDELPKRYKKLTTIDLVFVTGDIAFSGKLKEYDLAGRFFDDLQRVINVSPERIFFIPGNHDVDRSITKEETLRLRRSLKEHRDVNSFLDATDLRTRVFERQKNFREFAQKYSGIDKYSDYYFADKISHNGLEIGIVGLNSAWLCANRHDRTRLALGEPQVTNALRQIRDAELQIALVHHPFNWLKEFDQETCERDILTQCDFVLRGHLHRTDVTLHRNPDANTYVIAAGASYKTRDYLNSYNLVHLDFAETKVYGGAAFSRIWGARGKFWTDDVFTYKNRRGRYPLRLFKPRTTGSSSTTSVEPATDLWLPADLETATMTEIASEESRHIDAVIVEYDAHEQWWRSRNYKGNPFQVSDSRDVKDDEISDFWDWHQDPHLRRGLGQQETSFIQKQTVSQIARIRSCDIVVVYAPRGGGKTFYAKLCKERVANYDSKGIAFYIKNYDSLMAIEKVTDVQLAQHIHLQLWEQSNQDGSRTRPHPLPLQNVHHILLECEKLFDHLQRCYVFLDNLEQIFFDLGETDQKFGEKVKSFAELVNTMAKKRTSEILALRLFLPKESKAAFQEQLDRSTDRIHEYELVWRDTDCQQLLETRLESFFEGPEQERPAPNTYLLALVESDVIDAIFQELKRMQPLTPRRSLRLLNELTLYCYPHVGATDKITWNLWQAFIEFWRESAPSST